MGHVEHIHSKYLRKLTHQLQLAEIDRSEVVFTLVEPNWYRSSGNQRSLCDLLVGLKNGSAIPIELKANHLAKDDAIKQLSEGVHFANKVLYRPVPYGILMVYDDMKKLYHPPVKIIDELPNQLLKNNRYQSHPKQESFTKDLTAQ